ncbi:MAG: hypothetical protein M1825_005672 [Sarcosagium campestre]|nr:MAG: hypothetical protein M1825_005672 [Sarcosagium campestre]
MAAHNQLTPPSEGSPTSESNIRKRVGKACDRCRLKKSKCDGGSPCSRCKADNAICVFGERKKSHDKIYPKGYVEMLEQQQAQLVNGLQELYRRAKSGEGWTGGPLKDNGFGHPLTHDILERLGALRQDSQESIDTFEDDPRVLQQRMFERGATPMLRNQSTSSDSEQGSASQFDSPTSSVFSNQFDFGQAPPTPPTSSPFPGNVSAQTSFSTTSPFGQPSTVPSSLNPAQLQRQSWGAPSPAFFGEDSFEFLQKYQAGAAFEAAAIQLNRQSMPAVSAGPCLVPEFNDDEDFRSFFNQTVV